MSVTTALAVISAAIHALQLIARGIQTLQAWRQKVANGHAAYVHLLQQQEQLKRAAPPMTAIPPPV